MHGKESGDTAPEIRYAGFWVRLLASVIDTIVLALPLILVVYILSGGEWLDFSKIQQSIGYANSGEAMSALEGAKSVQAKWEIVFELLMAAVIIVFWKRWAGATPGKRILGIHVVDYKTGAEISNAQAVVRYIGYIASSIILMIGFLMIAFRRDKRALHDLMAGTAVVYK
ncbi:MAG: transporter [Helicobacteraceae bacterium 4484_230]|nr:MAG: transporter [Helicobacteraceae bacterium 4484_230]